MLWCNGKTVQRDGYEAAQLGLVEFVKDKHVRKPMAGHFKKADVAPVRFLREVGLTGNDEVNTGDRIQVNVFSPSDRVHVTGTSKGRGFRRSDQASRFQRWPGNPRIHVSPRTRINRGSPAYPSRVLKGTKMPGHMGAKRVTVREFARARCRRGKEPSFREGCGTGPQWRIRSGQQSGLACQRLK